ncbi:hypothetical protein GCM10023082_52870 [Streptomyces tremellae]|uniref:Uncharacterized protein n=1 Tax=Streptomyces tremellae TaxID=1124239 RepID=A0ABP7FWM3_9ACTN
MKDEVLTAACCAAETSRMRVEKGTVAVGTGGTSGPGGTTEGHGELSLGLPK